MAKVKKIFFMGVLSLLSILMCMPFTACGNEQAEEDKKETVDGDNSIAPCGLYTDLQFSLDGDNGQVSASVKNKFTLFPSTVTVKVELYMSYIYKENYTDMTLVATNSIHDLDQGETITATALTNGKSAYWKARASYRIDNKDWQENLSETMLFNENGIKRPVSATDDREYFISDFLQGDTESVYISIYPYVHKLVYDPDERYNEVPTTTLDADFWLKNDNELSTVKELFGKIKLNPFDLQTKTLEEQTMFHGSGPCAEFDMNISFDDGNKVRLYINNICKDDLGTNLFVTYTYTENGDKVYKNFTGLIDDEVKEKIIEFAKNTYEAQNNINLTATEWVKLADLLQGDVQTAWINLMIKRPDKVKFNIGEKDLLSVLNILNEVEVTPFDMDKELPFIKGSSYFENAKKYCFYSLSVILDNRLINIYVDGANTHNLGINLYVSCNNGENCQYFTGLLTNEMQKTLVDLAKNIYESKKENN